MIKPNFLILGAGKSSTTSLHYYLAQHPDVYMSEPKEPRFFELEYEKGMQFYWNNYFKGWSGQKAVGEASPSNFYLPYVPKRIKHSLPEAKLIAILRNPVDRAHSTWWMHYARGGEPLSFEEAISDSLKRIEAGVTFVGKDGEKLWRDTAYWIGKRKIQYRTYLDRGYYAQQLNRYLALFPRSQIKVVLFEDLCSSPELVVKDLWHFIGVEPSLNLKDSRPQYAAVPRIIVPLLRMAIASRLIRIVPNGMKSRLTMLYPRFGGKARMKDSTRKWLINHYYRHNRELERLLERDLSHWDK